MGTASELSCQVSWRGQCPRRRKVAGSGREDESFTALGRLGALR